MKDSIACTDDPRLIYLVSVEVPEGADTANIWVGDTIVAMIEVRKFPTGLTAQILLLGPNDRLRYVPLYEVEDAPA